MSKLSPQDENKIISFIKDWLKNNGFSLKDLANELGLKSGRKSEIILKMNELYKKGGMFNIAKKLIEVEQSWLNNNQSNPLDTNKLKPYNQLDLDYKVDIDFLMERMEKDHNKK